MKRTLLLAVFFLLFSFSANIAKADTVELRGGVIFSGQFGHFELSFSGYNSEGDSFRASGSGATSFGVNIPRPFNASAGTLVSFGGSVSLSRFDFGVAEFVINGITYQPNSLNLSFLSATSDTIPSSTASSVMLGGSCDLQGGLSGFLPPATVESVGFSGFCSARMSLNRTGTDAQGLGLYSFQSISYEFRPRPTPEPAALLLLGTGIAGIATMLRARLRR